ncbi:MAG: recombinase family protein, partial [Terriglobales bacterium]
MNAVIYARVSSREQEQEGFSIPAQLKLLRDYANKHGFAIAQEFVDIETAKTTGRPKFDEMVRFLKRSQNSRVILVEKTDRLYRNFRDAVTLEELDCEIHLVKENQVISKNAKSQAKLIHGMQLVLARNYIENLREEVKKGMREKAEQGTYPGRVPFGYRNNKGERTISVHSDNSRIVKRIFELYASGRCPLTELRNAIRTEFGITINRSYLHTILTNTFYVGQFVWGGQTYSGTHDTFISRELFGAAQDVLHGKHQGKYAKHEIAFRGLLTCAHDDCTVTAELKKGKYVYYRCSGYRGKCELPRFREEQISEKLGQILKQIYIPDEVLHGLLESFKNDQKRTERESAQQRERLEQRLANVRKRMDQAYTDKLDGKIPEDFWERKMQDWRAEEQQIQCAMTGLKEANSTDRVLTAQRILELANKAYFLYVTR